MSDVPAPGRPEDVQATFVATLVDEWVRGGVRAAVVCPGSRSTPLALALADHSGIAVQVHHDERSGGFLALGLALAGGAPVVVLTTSGTATAELHPAVVEAHHSGVPLLVCTADRPPELQDVGAPQTIDQTHLFGDAVRWFADPGVADPASAGRWRAFASRALVEAHGPPAGPVQLNLPFREPLVGTPGPLPPARAAGPWTTRLDTGASPTTGGLGVAAVAAMERLVGRRGVIVAGAASGTADDVVGLARRLGWPIVADPRADAWTPDPHVVAHLDGILRSDAARVALRPEVVLRLGASPASRVVNEWLAAGGAEHVIVTETGWSDPDAVAVLVVRAAPAHFVASLAAHQQAVQPRPPEQASGFTERPDGADGRQGMWLGHWQAAVDAAAEAVAAALAADGAPNEPAVARDVAAALPDGAQLVVSSSMPIRDVERYAEPRTGLRILANRGANGIDGVVSTAVGAALAGPPTALLIGDVAFLHDSNGLLGLAQRGVDLVIVVVDNDGGGIFSFLPQAGSLPGDRFETLFGTPHGLDLVALASAYGVDARAVTEGDDVGRAVAEAAEKGGVHVLVVRTDRAANVDVHRQVDDAVAAAVTARLTT